MKPVRVLGCAALIAATGACAQSVSSPSSSSISSSNAGWSSSQAGQMQLAEGSAPASAMATRALSAGSGSASAMPSAPAPAAQDNTNDYGWHPHQMVHHLTFEAGGGFNAPIGNDGPYITWGGNFTLGAGVRFSNRLSTLLEYQFMDNKLPGSLISAVNTASGNIGITGGDAHFNSITGSPMFDLTPKRSNGLYLVGGWGFYHKSTNFSSPEAVFSPFYGEYYENVTVASFTSNQWGGNAGFGLYHRVGSMYGESHTLIFAEARYTFIHTPPITQNNGLGTDELIPVTFGVRF